MQKIKTAGLCLLVGGILLILLYGIYEMVKELAEVNLVVLISILAILAGFLLLLISVVMDRKSKELDRISKEDMEP